MDKISLIPDKDFNNISKTVQELRKLYYQKKDLKIDFITLLFARIDELLELYAKALNKDADKEIFQEIKHSLQENCYLLQIALGINTIEDIKQIEHKKISKFELLQDEFSHYPIRLIGTSCFSFTQGINDFMPRNI